MTLTFEKYQGTGNDFIMLDNREKHFNVMDLPISALCDRKFGIGADGVIVIENHATLDFHMIYFNPDGSQSFCGNGSRCAVAYAHKLGIIKEETQFLSTDGAHYAKIQNGLVELKMHDVHQFSMDNNSVIINTGSPHHINFVDNVDAVDLLLQAREIRYNDTYHEHGINVNYIESIKHGIKIRTYERGVEGETLSCGTGVTAAAIANFIHDGRTDTSHEIKVVSRGGTLSVRFIYETDSTFREIYLIGPAEQTFKGSIEI